MSENTTELIDAIDELVDAALAAEEPVDNYDRCHFCGRHWHGLALTEKVATMYDWGHYDPAYRVADDDSPVVCPGSDFIGPPPPPREGSRWEWVLLGSPPVAGCGVIGLFGGVPVARTWDSQWGVDRSGRAVILWDRSTDD